MTAFVLKVIASVCMLFDHIGAEFSPAGMQWLNWIGRIAFPIYAFMIAQGCKHTKNINKYLLRLGVFALISEIPFDIAFKSQKIVDGTLSLNINFLTQTNVFYSLFFGAACIAIYEKLKTKRRVWPAMLALIIVPATLVPTFLLQNVMNPMTILGIGLLVYLAVLMWLSNVQEEKTADIQITPLRHIAALIPVVPIILLGSALDTDYGMYAIIYIVFFYFMKPESRVTRTIAVAVVAFVEYGYQYFYFLLKEFGVMPPLLPGKMMVNSADNLVVFCFALVAAVLVFFYNGRQGRKVKWAFYWFYPAHIAALAAVWFIIH